ncbi:alpha-(1,3)-fucosyltransferase C-like isoform X2 [Scylla paramamosain]|uniref:alpha-(1,3)-fucosyltransferase C-like isoform X2 n=2 Tax=Scylla paramamosain TaxID=85552 RepID=UPI003082733C
MLRGFFTDEQLPFSLAMRWRNFTRVRSSASQNHDLDAMKAKRLATLVVVVTVVSGVVYFLMGISYNYTQLPLPPPLPKIAQQLLATQIPATTRLPPPPSTVQHLQVPSSSHGPSPTNSSPLVTQTPKLSSLSPTPSPFVFHKTSTELLPGDSNLPYPSLSLENITNPPSRVFKEPKREPNDDDVHLKKILFWNDDYYNKHFGFGFGREPFLVAGCRVNTCTTTGDRTRYPIEEIDAVIWHFRSSDRSLPEYRSPHTRYVLWLMESPAYLFGDLQEYNNVFNWTFTYRLDSDFLLRYNQVFRRRDPLPPTDHNYAAGKTKLAAWFVSHCTTDSGRITLTRTLQQWIPVDVFGACGPFECPRKHTKECYGMLNASYKFYLSFENSLCRDYITEKFFNILRLDVVPVVFGLGNYSAMAPPHSYIDALSFPSVSALATYLLYLHHNDTAYNEYFRWKRFHKLFNFWALSSQEYCSLCERLHTDNTTKTYDIHKWYVEDAHCKTKNSPDVYDFINAAPQISNMGTARSLLICVLIMVPLAWFS